MALALMAPTVLPGAAPAAAAEPQITVIKPTPGEAVPAGPVTFKGTASSGGPTTAGGPTTVLYVLDASGSTGESGGLDCNADSVAGDALDNLNGDAVAGSILDCEIAAVERLNAELATSAGVVQTGLVAFAAQAFAASVDPSDPTLRFIPAGDSRLSTVARSITRSGIGQFQALSFGGRDGNFAAAVDTALATLQSAPAGQHVVFFLSDGGDGDDQVTDSMRAALTQSGASVRTFDFGASDCEEGALQDLAVATGETCVGVPNPAQLGAQLSGSQSATVKDVVVMIGGVALTTPDPVDAVGGWEVTGEIGAGAYTATIIARSPAGATVASTQVSFTVTAPPPGTVAPPPGTVKPGVGAMLASDIRAKRPKPHRTRVPLEVKGRVGMPGASGLVATPALDGATVQLLGKTRLADTWRVVARDQVEDGRYALTWKKRKLRRLDIRHVEVQLAPFGQYAASTSSVKTAKISNCKVRRVDGRRVLTCHTTLPNRTRARLLDHGDVIDRARVRKGKVKVVTRQRLGDKVLVLDKSRKRHVRLHL